MADKLPEGVKIMRRTIKIISVVILILVFSLGYFVVGAYRGESGGRPVRVELTSPDVALATTALEKAGVFGAFRGFVFEIVAAGTRADRDFHAGVFMVPVGAGVRDAIRILKTHSRAEVSVTVPEGSDLADLAKIFGKAGLVKNEAELYAVTGRPTARDAAPEYSTADFSFLGGKPKGLSLEGYIFPDTYRFFADSSPAEIVKKMLDVFEARTAELRTETVAGLNFHEALTLASILEKEVKSDNDRRKVADIFLRRIKAGMGLQADSTVNYATGKSSLFTSSSDRDSDNLWNTYKYRGLPPGPIGNPGLAAIRAVLNPDPNDFWYFLTAPDGTVYYAKTLEEHNANKKYLK